MFQETPLPAIPLLNLYLPSATPPVAPLPNAITVPNAKPPAAKRTHIEEFVYSLNLNKPATQKENTLSRRTGELILDTPTKHQQRPTCASMVIDSVIDTGKPLSMGLAVGIRTVGHHTMTQIFEENVDVPLYKNLAPETIDFLKALVTSTTTVNPDKINKTGRRKCPRWKTMRTETYAALHNKYFGVPQEVGLSNVFVAGNRDDASDSVANFVLQSPLLWDIRHAVAAEIAIPTMLWRPQHPKPLQHLTFKC
ncbi:unnamed protein product, partial [Caenorhabditis auriculariae]